MSRRGARVLIGAVEEFADPEHQQRSWIEGRGQSVSSYEEALCTLFDDAWVEEILSGKGAQELGLTPECIRTLRAFVEALDQFDKRIGSRQAEDVLRSPDWTQVRALARDAADGLR